MLLLGVWAAFSPLWAVDRSCAKKLALLESHGTEVYIAKKAGLDYQTDIETKGITRKVRGKTISYFNVSNTPITNQKTIERFEGIKIPLVYTDVIISSNPKSHLQYTAVDSSGKKQYRYHPNWNQERKKQKFARVAEFGAALPQLRKIVDHDLKVAKNLSKERVLAAMIRIMDKTAIRVGNEEYAEENGTYGLSTLEKRHVKVVGSKVTLTFIGKADKKQILEYEDLESAKVLSQLLKTPGTSLFNRTSDELNVYLAKNMGEIFTVKDFRSWTGTVTALEALQQTDSSPSRAVEAVAEKLGNTPSIAKKHYIHPTILEAFDEGNFVPANRNRKQGLSAAESQVLTLLK